MNENVDTHIDYNINGIMEKINYVNGIFHLRGDRNINNPYLDIDNLVLVSIH
jgi:hypothetical protein